MENKNLENMNHVLEDEMIENNRLIRRNKEKATLAEVNQFESKLVDILGCSLIPYFVGTLLLFTFFPTMPWSIVLVTSLTVGTTIHYVLDKKNKIKERFQSFSKATTEIEKFLEETKYEIEVKKLENKNKVLNEIKEAIALRQSMIDTFSSQNDMLKKDTSTKKEEVQDLIEKNTKELEQKYEKLDILTVQKHLSNRFLPIINSTEKIRKMWLSLIVSVSIATLICSPMIFLNSSASSFLVSMAIVSTISISANIKRNKKYIQVFHQMNKLLKENALVKEYDCDIANKENKKMNKELNATIKELSLLKFNLEEQKQLLRDLTKKEEDEKKRLLQEKIKENQTIEEFQISLTSEFAITNEEKPKIKKKTLFH